MKFRTLQICLVAAAFTGGVSAVALAQGPAPSVKLKQRDNAKKDEKAKSPQANGTPKVGDKAIDWSLKDSDGKTVKLSDLKGKVVVMDFWATWCGPCRKAMPDIQKLHEEFKDKNVLVYGLNAWEKDDTKADKSGKKLTAAEKAKGYMADQKFTYGLLLGADDVATKHGLTGIPAFFIIDTKGKVVYAESGYSPSHYAEMKKVIKTALDEAAKETPADGKKPADASKPAEKSKPTTETPPAKKG